MGRCPFYKIWLVQDGFCANMYRVLFIDGQMSRLLQFRVPRRRKGASKARHLPEQTVGLCQSIALKVFLINSSRAFCEYACVRVWNVCC